MKAKKNYYERFVGITPKDYENLEDRHKKTLEIFSGYKFDRILDVGCYCEIKQNKGAHISGEGKEAA